MAHVKWEYLVEGLPGPSGQAVGIVRSNASIYIDPVQYHLNCRGEEGWELVEISGRDGAPTALYSDQTIFVFKRLKL